jgi:hypothetical protein
MSLTEVESYFKVDQFVRFEVLMVVNMNTMHDLVGCEIYKMIWNPIPKE